MDEMIKFLAVMSAMSASSQTITLQLKKRMRWLKFTEPQGDNVDQKLLEHKRGKHHAKVHFVSGVNGAVLALLGNVHPLQLLGLNPIWADAGALADLLDFTSAGVLVAYGGPWFHEFLGILREYKQNLRGAK